MFPTRYFAPEYFAPRYWPKAGADGGAPEEPGVLSRRRRMKRLGTASVLVLFLAASCTPVVVPTCAPCPPQPALARRP
jgi:hypothetical protein